MSKKSKKMLAKAEKMMASALIMKAEAMKLQTATTAENQLRKNNYSYTTYLNKWTVGTAIGVLILIAGIVCGALYLNNRSLSSKPVAAEILPPAPPDTAQLNPTDSTIPNVAIITGVTATEVWKMPIDLTEISSQVFIDEERVACVQDADGIIYIYNLKSRKVEKEISFGGQGDYEGLALVDSSYYVLSAEGFLTEVQPSNNGKPVVKKYDLPFGKKNDTESMLYDKANNRLLIGVKEMDLAGGTAKSVYAFDLAKKKLAAEPVFTLTDPNDKQTSGKGTHGRKKKRSKVSFKPSEIVVNPNTGEYYILNGPKAEFLIANTKGEVTTRIQLDKSIFPQPEGICFSPSGELYISSEGVKKGGGIIAKVTLNQ